MIVQMERRGKRVRSGTVLSELLVGDIHADGVVDVQHYAACLIVSDAG